MTSCCCRGPKQRQLANDEDKKDTGDEANDDDYADDDAGNDDADDNDDAEDNDDANDNDDADDNGDLADDNANDDLAFGQCSLVLVREERPSGRLRRLRRRGEGSRGTRPRWQTVAANDQDDGQ